MRCYHCNQEIENGAEHCPYCGSFQGAGATTVLDGAYNPYAQPDSGATVVLSQEQYADYYQEQAPVQKPAIQFKADRSLLKMILFGILTLGIYDVVVWCQWITELNVAACRYDGKRTMPYFAMTALAPFTFGIYMFVWFHKLCNRVGEEVARRGYDYKFNASTFWLWNVLGSLILIGPFVFVHKMCQAMNLINGDFNEYG